LAHDRLELRAKNFLRQGETLATGERLETAVWLPQCLDAVKQALGPKPRPSAEHKVVGRGWAANLQPYGRTVWFDDHAACWMNLEEDGSVVIRIGVPDVGGGQAAALCQIAAEVLKLPPSRIRPYFGDSALTPLAGGTFATRQLYMSGHAVLLAARTLRRNILETASAMMHVPVEELDLDDGVVKAPTGAVPLRELVRRGVQIGRPLAVHETFFAERGPVFDNQRGRAVKTFPDYTYGVHGCDVEVDVETGAVRILRYVAAHDVGRAINPLSVEGQIQGGVAQGIGYALSEEVLYQNGQCLNSLFAQYLIPTAQDVPPIHPVILESGEGKGPFHARGIGEPAISPVAAAIANAVADAIGVRITALPITAEKIVRALQRLS
jgi:CO/xanthine dehydrogenase Mo-binding subunit